MPTSLNNYLRRATAELWAIPHFNACNLEQLRGIVAAAAALRAPVMIGTSEGERAIFTPEAAVAIVKIYSEKFWSAAFPQCRPHPQRGARQSGD